MGIVETYTLQDDAFVSGICVGANITVSNRPGQTGTVVGFERDQCSVEWPDEEESVDEEKSLMEELKNEARRLAQSGAFDDVLDLEHPSDLFPGMTREEVRNMPIQYAKPLRADDYVFSADDGSFPRWTVLPYKRSVSMGKHHSRLNRPQYVPPPSETSLGLLMLREARGENFVVPFSQEARVSLRKALHIKRKAESDGEAS